MDPRRCNRKRKYQLVADERPPARQGVFGEGIEIAEPRIAGSDRSGGQSRRDPGGGQNPSQPDVPAAQAQGAEDRDGIGGQAEHRGHRDGQAEGENREKVAPDRRQVAAGGVFQKPSPAENRLKKGQGHGLVGQENSRPGARLNGYGHGLSPRYQARVSATWRLKSSSGT